MSDKRLIKLGESIHDALVELYYQDKGQWSKDLRGACAVGSWFLYSEAKKRLNINIKFLCNDYHAWNEFNGHIFDITATQYGLFEKVFVVPKSNLETITDRYHRSMYTNLDRVSIEHINRVWIHGQCPKNFRLRWLAKNKLKLYYKESSYD